MEEAFRLENQLCFPLYACARRVVGKYTPLLKPLNLTYTQYIVFLVLWAEETTSVRDLCRRLYLDSGTLTPLLKKMEKEGFVEKKRNPKDERIVMISITQKGKDMQKKLQGVPEQVGSCIPLDAQEAITLYSLLYKVLGTMDENEEE